MRPLMIAGLMLSFVLPACGGTVLDNARVRGTVKVAQRHDLHHGAPIRVAFRALSEECKEEDVCSRNWNAMESCSVSTAERATEMRVTLGAYDVPFEACTGAIDAERDVEVLAFIDLDGDGALSVGEPFGVEHAGKARRELASLEIAIGRTP